MTDRRHKISELIELLEECIEETGDICLRMDIKDGEYPYRFVRGMAIEMSDDGVKIPVIEPSNDRG
mgnify:CR=1 FL=1|tara:strand:+ start:580 stop:777 length:198 start_codon:yes stop_codon:yes gene_type:complete